MSSAWIGTHKKVWSCRAVKTTNNPSNFGTPNLVNLLPHCNYSNLIIIQTVRFKIILLYLGMLTRAQSWTPNGTRMASGSSQLPVTTWSSCLISADWIKSSKPSEAIRKKLLAFHGTLFTKSYSAVVALTELYSFGMLGTILKYLNLLI